MLTMPKAPGAAEVTKAVSRFVFNIPQAAITIQQAESPWDLSQKDVADRAAKMPAVDRWYNVLCGARIRQHGNNAQEAL